MYKAYDKRKECIPLTKGYGIQKSKLYVTIIMNLCFSSLYIYLVYPRDFKAVYLTDLLLLG